MRRVARFRRSLPLCSHQPVICCSQAIIFRLVVAGTQRPRHMSTDADEDNMGSRYKIYTKTGDQGSSRCAAGLLLWLLARSCFPCMPDLGRVSCFQPVHRGAATQDGRRLRSTRRRRRTQQLHRCRTRTLQSSRQRPRSFFLAYLPAQMRVVPISISVCPIQLYRPFHARQTPSSRIYNRACWMSARTWRHHGRRELAAKSCTPSSTPKRCRLVTPSTKDRMHCWRGTCRSSSWSGASTRTTQSCRRCRPSSFRQVRGSSAVTFIYLSASIWIFARDRRHEQLGSSRVPHGLPARRATGNLLRTYWLL